jgi:hypothetical protein
MPWFIFEDEVKADSTFGLRYFVRKGILPDLDKDLTTEQRAQSRVLQGFIEDHLYFLLVYERWAVDSNFKVGLFMQHV